MVRLVSVLIVLSLVSSWSAVAPIARCVFFPRGERIHLHVCTISLHCQVRRGRGSTISSHYPGSECLPHTGTAPHTLIQSSMTSAETEGEKWFWSSDTIESVLSGVDAKCALWEAGRGACGRPLRSHMSLEQSGLLVAGVVGVARVCLEGTCANVTKGSLHPGIVAFICAATLLPLRLPQ